jgi:hypothetical protein
MFVALGHEACESQRPADVLVRSIAAGSTTNVGRGDGAELYVGAGMRRVAIGGATPTGYAFTTVSLDGTSSVAAPVVAGGVLVAQPEATGSN